MDDIIETANHFRCIDLIIEKAKSKLTESFIKEIHFLLKSGTSQSSKDWFNVGDYKKFPNEVGGSETCPPKKVPEKIKKLLSSYYNIEKKTIEDIIDFHQKFEVIHPFQDGNGRVGRLIMFKECLANNVVPFIIDDDLKLFYYRGLQEWNKAREYLLDTCLTAQDNFKTILKYFEIGFEIKLAIQISWLTNIFKTVEVLKTSVVRSYKSIVSLLLLSLTNTNVNVIFRFIYLTLKVSLS